MQRKVTEHSTECGDLNGVTGMRSELAGVRTTRKGPVQS